MHDRRILLAEEDLEHSGQLREHLQQLRYSVEVHSDGLTALRRLQEPDTPGMALLSSSLPRLTGLEVGLEIRRRSRRRQLWLMLMSANPNPDEVIMATDAGIDEFLVKPIDLTDLHMRIRTGERVQDLYAELSDSALAMEFHCTHDPLTGAWRREAILDMIFKETDRAQRSQTAVSIVLLDVDDFTLLNSKYGSNVADMLLKLLANRLRRQLRSYDALGRYSNDEFVIMLPGCRLSEAAAKAERIRRAVANRPFMVDGNEISMTASLSVAVSAGRSPLIILREAERTLLLAKQPDRHPVQVAGETPSAEGESPALRRFTERVD